MTGLHFSYMVTDTEKWCKLDEPYILITDKKISNAQDLLPVLEQIVQQAKTVDYSGDIEGGSGHISCE